jgi:pimeloyl-ACP methyl ester carboxylesterase
VVRALALLSLVWIAFAARSSAQTPQPFPPAPAPGRMIVLPGIHNTLFHLDGFIDMARVSLPNFHIDRRKWGLTFLGIINLRAEEKNVAFARTLAADITRWRRDNPDALLYLMGYSGGGGVAALVLAELPADVYVDRLILIAPAISSEFPIESYAAEHVSDFVINFASRKDMQVGLGTKLFGTIDRKYEYAAGYQGFAANFDRLAQWHWNKADRQIGHRGNHVAYLGRRWQRDFLLPAMDPSVSRNELERLWRERRDPVEPD